MTVSVIADTLQVVLLFQSTFRALMSVAIAKTTMASAPWTALLFVGTGGARYIADRKAIASAKKLIAKAGGVEAVKKASQNPNIGTTAIGGVTANDISEALELGEE